MKAIHLLGVAALIVTILVLTGLFLLIYLNSSVALPPSEPVTDYNLQDYVGVWVNSNVPAPNIIPSLSKFTINNTIGRYVITFYYQGSQPVGCDDWMFAYEANYPNNHLIMAQGQPIGDIQVECAEGFALSYINATALQVYQAMPYQVTSTGVISPALLRGVFLRASASG